MQLSYRLADSQTYWFGPIMKLSWKIRNLSLCRNIFEHFIQISPLPPSSRDNIENSIRPFSIWLQHFFNWS